jgi:hypothetical protein
MSELANCKEMSKKGLEFIDENGETKLIPRFKSDGGYKFTKEEEAARNRWFAEMRLQNPSVDATMITHLIDFYIKHPEKFEEEFKKLEEEEN